jgi:hypothetical protein
MMTTPQATISQSHDELLAVFKNLAVTSFGKSVDAINEEGFYQHVLAKMQAETDLSADLPELKKMKESAAKAVVKRLSKQAKESAETAWELSSNVSKLFRTTIRSHQDDLSLLPCFDVEYKAETPKGDVTIAAKTWRRNVTVTIDGKDAALDLLHGQIVMAGMRDNT